MILDLHTLLAQVETLQELAGFSAEIHTWDLTDSRDSNTGHLNTENI
jgi:hypothetical protein